MPAADNASSLRRREVVARILHERADTLLVSGLGSPTYDCAAAGDDGKNFYLWGAMGSAVMVGLGLALAQRRRRVLVITGDGEMLMGLGSLATAAVKKPGNLAVVVLDNERYGETGMQATHTALGLDLAAVAASVGFREARTVRDDGALEKTIPLLYAAPGPILAVVKVSAERDPLVLPPRDGTFLKNRFRQALLGPVAA